MAYDGLDRFDHAGVQFNGCLGRGLLGWLHLQPTQENGLCLLVLSM